MRSQGGSVRGGSAPGEIHRSQEQLLGLNRSPLSNVDAGETIQRDGAFGLRGVHPRNLSFTELLNLLRERLCLLRLTLLDSERKELLQAFQIIRVSLSPRLFVDGQRPSQMWLRLRPALPRHADHRQLMESPRGFEMLRTERALVALADTLE